MHAYGLLLELIPYRVWSVGRLSLAVSLCMLALVWGLARRLASELWEPALAPAAGLGAVAVLVSNPVFWRLSGAATFWPWPLTWVLTSALAGLWAARSCASDDARVRTAGAAAWVLAAIGLAFAAAGNFVCLTLGVCVVIGPLCWSRGERSAALRRAATVGPLALAVFALLVAPDYREGFSRAFEQQGVDGSVTATRMLEDFNPLLLDAQLVTPVWAIACVLALVLAVGLRLRSPATSRSSMGALRVLAPLACAYLLPAAFLGLAAGELVGSSYPSGFINHHWELVFTAIFVGLALASLVRSLERLRPWSDRWVWLVPTVLSAAALLLAARAREGWRMATGARVLERELIALDHSFASLPEHDLLVVAPRVLPPMTDAPTQWDPLEVVFPVGFYEHALRERGLEPGLVVSLDRLPTTQPGERILLYVGSSLRSFQPHEIAAGVVPDSLERPELSRLRHGWALEPVHEFAIPTEQHEAISLRLGADRRESIELGFYWMRRQR